MKIPEVRDAYLKQINNSMEIDKSNILNQTRELRELLLILLLSFLPYLDSLLFYYLLPSSCFCAKKKFLSQYLTKP